MSSHEEILALVLAAAAVVFAYIAGKHRPAGRILEDTYELGRDDEAAYQDWRADHEFGQTVMLDGSIPLRQEEEATPVQAPPPGALAHDWLTAVHEQLAPEHIQDDSPGPVAPAPRAGGLNWWDEAPLPAVLGLGQEFSGDDKTFARWQVRRWEFRRQCGLPALEAA